MRLCRCVRCVDDTLLAEEEESVVDEGAEKCTCEGCELDGQKNKS